MASGVRLDGDSLSDYNNLKANHKYKYLIFGLNEGNTQIVTLEKGDLENEEIKNAKSEEEKYEVFRNRLPENECRWAVYDLSFETEGGGRRDKLVFLSWSPDTAGVKNKMLFASSKETLRVALSGALTTVQATDGGEASYEAVLDKAKR